MTVVEVAKAMLPKRMEARIFISKRQLRGSIMFLIVGLSVVVR
jgi:hypothetical protein